MKRNLRISMILVLLAAGIAVLGCSRTVYYKSAPPRTTDTVQNDRHGPPPHAPAHGYRHKHGDGVVLVYDSDLHVYLVSGYKDVYYYKGSYYRWHNGKWQTTRKVNGPWQRSYAKKVPKHLHEHVAVYDRSKTKTKDDYKGKGKDNGKGKGFDDDGKGKGKDDDGKGKGKDKDDDDDGKGKGKGNGNG